MRRDHPPVREVELHVQSDPDPAHLQTTTPPTRPAQAGACVLGKERAALDHHFTHVRLKDRDLVDGVVGSHDQRRQGIHVGEADAVRRIAREALAKVREQARS